MAEQIREMAKAFAKKMQLAGEAGVTAVEYALMAALIAAVVIVGALALGTATNNCLQDVATDITASSRADAGC